ncbi:MAG: response regulator transcription factor [Gammaproteobacteria bacterium]|nr:response regulator transcription factor [Gammaproteobacteria bacterium]
MRVLVADDERLARERLVALLRECGSGYEIVGGVANGHEVLERCATGDVDLVLLDIRMPGMDGIEAALQLAGRPNPPAVVFVTAYGEHALAAFDANAIDYLLKPVRLDRLQRALDKAGALSAQQVAVLGDGEAFITATYRGNPMRIAIADVLFLRADAKYVEVWQPGGMALTEESLRSIEQRLPGLFLRVHRNALVARSRVRGLARDGDGQLSLRLDGCEEQVEVSRRHAAEVRRLLRGDI